MASLFVVNGAHLHLVLNHIPTLGAAIGLALLVLSFFRQHEGLQQAGLEVLFLVAVLTMPVYITGVMTYKSLPMGAEVTDRAIRVHQDAALAGFTVAEFAGFIAWLALWQGRRRRSSRSLVAAATVLSVVALAVMARVATLGGEIHHPEIRAAVAADKAVPAPAEAKASTYVPGEYAAADISRFMVRSRWAWPAAETLHFLGLSLSFGVLMVVNLRLLGLMRQVPFGDVHLWLPFGMLGFGANLITGMLFFIGQPGQYTESTPFYWKIVLLVLAGANYLYLTVFTRAWSPGQLEPRLSDKAMAISSLAVWLAILYAGRMLPFIGNAF